MTCAQGLLRLLWGGGARSWSATGLSQLSKIPGLLPRINKLVAKNYVVLLFFSLVLSRVQLRTSMWGETAKHTDMSVFLIKYHILYIT